MAIIQGEAGVKFVFNIKNLLGTPVSLTNATVNLRFKGGSIAVDKECTIMDEANGKCFVKLNSDDLSMSGPYYWQATVTYDSGDKFSNETQTFTVLPKLA